MAQPKFWMIGAAAVALGFTAIGPRVGPAARAQAQMAATMHTQMTPSYTVELDIGPAAEMLTPDQAMTMGIGEVMVSMPDMGMSMPSAAQPSSQSGMSTGGDAMSMMPMMATTDGGQPVNHHLEVHVLDNASGAPDATVDPQITITSESNGQSHTVDDVAAMYDEQMGMGDLHYGNNIYLADGTYTIAVTIGSETATFQHVPVANGAGLPMDSMGSMMPEAPMSAGH